MQILLPPSETKRTGGSGQLQEESLFAAPELGHTRQLVRTALETLSASGADEDAAAKVLKLGVKNRGELAYNRSLVDGPVMPAIERYTGVLYDALGIEQLSAAARGWVDDHVFVQSALFGVIRASDRIPAYRLSASSRLPALDAPLKRAWPAAHAQVCSAASAAAGGSLLLDLRSKDYAALAPIRQGEGYFVHVAQRGVDGEVRALNHFNKAAKGDLVAKLAESGRDVHTLSELIDWAEAAGLELHEADGVVTLVTTLGTPA